MGNTIKAITIPLGVLITLLVVVVSGALAYQNDKIEGNKEQIRIDKGELRQDIRNSKDDLNAKLDLIIKLVNKDGK